MISESEWRARLAIDVLNDSFSDGESFFSYIFDGENHTITYNEVSVVFSEEIMSKSSVMAVITEVLEKSV